MAVIEPDDSRLRPSQVPDALRTLLATAIAKLGEPSIRAAATELFGIPHDSPNGRNTLSLRLVRAYEKATGKVGVSYHTIRLKPDYDRAIVEEVGNHLVQIIERPLGAPVEEPYVHRPELEGQCADVIRGGARIIVLAGDAGTGKTTLARHVVAGLVRSPTPAVEIDASDNELLFDGLIRGLAAYGVYGVANLPEAKLRFAELLRQSNQASRPAAISLHNVDDDRVVHSLVPSDSRTIVFITSNNAALGAGRWPIIEVGNMEADEAVSLVQLRLPALNADEAERLARFLGGNPLAIEHVCRYLARPSSLPLDDFLDAVTQNVAIALELPQEARPLTLAYRLSLEQMDERSRRLLDITLSAGSTGIHLDYIADLWAHLEGTPPDIASSAQLAKIALDAALSDLESRSLIRRHGITRGAPPGPSASDAHQPVHMLIKIHSLTQCILYRLRAASVTNIRHRILGRLDATAELAEWALGTTLPISTLFRLRASIRLVMTVAEDVAAAHPGACAVALRCAYQFGHMPAKLADRAALAWYRQADAIASGDDGRNVAATPLSVELVHYLRCNPRQEYATATRGALAKIRHHNSGLWHAVGLLSGDEWLPAPVLGTPVQPMLALTDVVISGYWSAITGTEVGGRDYDRLMLATWFRVRGKLNFDLGRFATADQSYQTALHNYQKVGAEQHHAEVLTCLRQLAETALKAGRYDDADGWLQEAHRLVSRPDSPENPDYITMLRHQQTIARVGISRRLRKARPGESAEVSDWAAAAYGKSLDLAQTGPLAALYPAARHGALCLQAPVDPEAAHAGTVELADWCNDQHWHFAALRSRLTALKLLAHIALEGDDTRLRHGVAARALHTAYTFRRKYQAFYWAADALATAVALGHIVGQSERWVAEVRAEARTALDNIGRPDKLEIAEDVVSGNFSALQMLAE